MVCYDLTGWPGERPFLGGVHSSEANLPRVAQNRKLAALGTAGRATGQDDEAVAPGRRNAHHVRNGSICISSGATASDCRQALVIAVPAMGKDVDCRSP